ncbi:hypothetical protein [Amaricoccus sp.]|uniref:hypothetical protein n=1 Tax=Amaricoccus sp. TaxID=1872485 RepID=UPI00261D7C39|nr:hypothetical protein [Amaricoccus sp.]HRO11271.1 hypothetical protein [Amaricoccus sp.]
MSAEPRHPGATPVGRLAELPPLEREVIHWLRLWCAGPDGPRTVSRELVARHGEAGRDLAADFDELVGTLAGHSRRPLVGHAPGCPCAGADECVFARFVALAAEGAREDAVLMAALMVRADLALCLANRAETIGLRLMRGRTPRIVQ